MKMKKPSAFITFVLILPALLLALCTPTVALAASHPDPQSGKPADYAGTWIINGTTEANTTWTLEIRADGTYTLSNEYQSFEGDFTFLPSPGTSMGDRLLFKLDPEQGIEMMLENTANALVDLSGQGLIFVKPGNKANLDKAKEDIEEIEQEDFLGEWKLDSISVSYKDYSMSYSAEELLEGSGGDKWIVLSLKDNVISQLSTENYLRVPIARYRWIGDDTFVFNNPIKMGIYQTYTGLFVNPRLMVMMAFPEPEDTVCMMFFTRVYDVVTTEE